MPTNAAFTQQSVMPLSQTLYNFCNVHDTPSSLTGQNQTHG